MPVDSAAIQNVVDKKKSLSPINQKKDPIPL